MSDQNKITVNQPNIHVPVVLAYIDQSTNCPMHIETSVTGFLFFDKFLFNFSAKIAVHVSAPGPSKKPGPVTQSRYDYIRFSFREAGEGQVRSKVQAVNN